MDPFFMRFLPQSGTSCREIWVRLQDKDYQHFVQYGLILHILTDIPPALYLKYQFHDYIYHISYQLLFSLFYLQVHFSIEYFYISD